MTSSKAIPTTRLQTALLEALDAADKLQASLEGDSKALADLLKKQEVGYLAGAISGVAPTVPEDKKLTKITTDVQEEGRGALSFSYRQQLEAAGKDQKLSESATKTYYDSIAVITAAGVEKVQPILQHSYDMQRENNERIENLRRLHILTAVSAAVGGARSISISAPRSMRRKVHSRSCRTSRPRCRPWLRPSHCRKRKAATSKLQGTRCGSQESLGGSSSGSLKTFLTGKNFYGISAKPN